MGAAGEKAKMLLPGLVILETISMFSGVKKLYYVDTGVREGFLKLYCAGDKGAVIDNEIDI